jgi:hypothetical protein
MLNPLHLTVGDTVNQDQRSLRVAETTKAVQTQHQSVSVAAMERELRMCGFA